ncbi:transcriptional regulatory protein CpxR [mine drainage metagenome]|uniref:Transcriptional regulatory protein CpxR n=1 Tax=mine drainage metagenome TaxID=410659 RepID=A0A1J5QNP9_9ZZZZ
MMNKILLIDDDIELTAMLKEFLAAEGFEVTIANDGESGARHALSGLFDLAVLDVMMPKLNGIETLRLIRQASHIPVIMLTARGDESDRFFGLELGADDYVPKPCTPRELTARIRAILRRSKLTQDSTPQINQLVIGNLSMWPEQRRAEWSGKTLNLTSTEFNLLEVLARNAGQVVSKKDLAKEGMGRPLVRFDRSIDVHMSSIRQKMGTLYDGRDCIQTVYRMGYQLVKE